MALADDIRALRDRTVAALVAAHDYFADTKTAWKTVAETVAAGRQYATTNPVTGTTTTAADLVAKAQGYVNGPLIGATFQQFLSAFETFVFDLLRLWLTAYPRSVAGRKLDFKTVLDAPDRDAIVAAVIGRELNDVLYERPAGWFAYLEGKAKLGRPTADQIERIAEAKATRDVLVHGQGVAGPTYIDKAGRLARFAAGDPLDIPEPYHREIYELLLTVVREVANAAATKPG